MYSMEMQKQHIPDNDNERLDALRRYNILDTPPEEAFDRFTSIIATICEVPIALISFVDKDRIWFKSHYGINTNQVGRDPGLCASAIINREFYQISDTLKDSRTVDHPMVKGGKNIRFYAASPLTSHDGHQLGVICILDKVPRTLSEEQTFILEQLSKIIMDEMELRLSTNNLLETMGRLHDAESRPEDMEKFITICAWSKKVKVGNKWMKIEDFLRSRHGYRISHGITEESAQKIIVDVEGAGVDSNNLNDQ